MTGTQQALTSATLEAQMCVHPQNRALPNVFNDGNLAEPLIGTRVRTNTRKLLLLNMRSDCIVFTNEQRPQPVGWQCSRRLVAGRDLRAVCDCQMDEAGR